MGNRSCPVCGGNDSNIIERIHMDVPKSYHLPNAYDIVTCENCGFVYADTSASMEDYDWYYAKCNFYGDDSKDDNSARFDMVEELLEQYVGREARLLEFGAGNGRFSIALKRHGYENIVATDPSEESVMRLREAGIVAHRANLYADVREDEQESYDGIFLFEVAEHLLNPGKAAGNIGKMLKKDGIFMMSVPDYSRIGEDEGYIPNYFNLEHINYFSETSANYLMAQHGMERIAQKHCGIDLIQVYRKTGCMELPVKDMATERAVRKFLSRQRQKMERIQKKILSLRENGQEIVIWGTGSYVMSLFATTELPLCRISGFVDNNKLKQGREIYGHMVYPPSYLEGKSCTVVVCSMLYGEQIKKQIEEMHTGNRIVVL